MSQFSVRMNDVLEMVDAVDPLRYARTRNFINGSVTRLSPYLSRGVISTRLVLDRLVAKGHGFGEVEKLVQELAWRDYYQRVWQAVGNELNRDLRQPQDDVAHHKLPNALPMASTGIEAVDEAIRQLYTTGYMHNHCRMYLASIACNAGQAHWLQPARWLYYHLMDGDWASNALSWQWVAGSFSSKKYVANQENINKYTGSSQKGSFLDVAYERFPLQHIPESLQQKAPFQLATKLPENLPPLKLEDNLPLFVYNYYHLDPLWRKEEPANRVLLLEPDFFAAYPVSEVCMDFILRLSAQLPGLQVFVGSFDQLKALAGNRPIVFREHPLNRHYQGQEDSREWMVPEVSGYYPSFFGYWKKVERVLRKRFK